MSVAVDLTAATVIIVSVCKSLVGLVVVKESVVPHRCPVVVSLIPAVLREMAYM